MNHNVFYKICTYLDPLDIINLRQTCTTFKRWGSDIEKNRLLELFPLIMNDAFYIIAINLIVYFDYNTKEIILPDQDVYIDDMKSQIEDIFESKDDKDLHMHVFSNYIKCYFENGVKWYNIPLCNYGCQLTKLVISNISGFNGDHRSHRGDDLFNESIEKSIIRRKIYPHVDYYDNDKFYDANLIMPNIPDINDPYNENYSESEDYFESIDSEYYYYDKYTIYNKNGLTWGDFMHGLLCIKGSKSDWGYELLNGLYITKDDNTIDVLADFDHGS